MGDAFKNFRKICLKTYYLDPLKFLSAPGLACQAALEKTELKLELLTNVGMLLIVEKGIRGGISHAVHRYVKANDKCIKNYDENKESLYLKYYAWTMSEKLPVNSFDWIEHASQLMKIFPWRKCSISWNITWTSQWSTIFT